MPSSAVLSKYQPPPPKKADTKETRRTAPWRKMIGIGVSEREAIREAISQEYGVRSRLAGVRSYTDVIARLDSIETGGWW